MSYDDRFFGVLAGQTQAPFERNDKVKLLSTDNIFPDLKGIVFCPMGDDFVKVDFNESDNPRSKIFSDNNIRIFRLHRVRRDKLERWKQ